MLKQHSAKFLPPTAISPAHDVSQFSCGEIELEHWLIKRALENEDSGASRTYVMCDSNHTVIAYYCLATGAVAATAALGKVRRNMPDPIPVMIIGRLAVHQKWHGHGIGPALLKDALLRTYQAAKIAGIRAVLVHALNDRARAFYEKYGFEATPIEPYTLMVRLKDIEHLIE